MADRPEVEISFDRDRIDFEAASRLIRASYWGKRRTDAGNRRAFDNSLCVAAFIDGEQVGFGRVMTDYACFAYLCDVVVWPDRRGAGIGKKLVGALLDHPELAGVLAFSLRTTDAQSFYEAFGFEVSNDGMYMRLVR
ncbi:GNAT family N-acetyltransferase [Aquamicrobium terrae]